MNDGGKIDSQSGMWNAITGREVRMKVVTGRCLGAGESVISCSVVK